jgi:hypothetical protein
MKPYHLRDKQSPLKGAVGKVVMVTNGWWAWGRDTHFFPISDKCISLPLSSFLWLLREKVKAYPRTTILFPSHFPKLDMDMDMDMEKGWRPEEDLDRPHVYIRLSITPLSWNCVLYSFQVYLNWRGKKAAQARPVSLSLEPIF